jgi:hypothetical protein
MMPIVDGLEREFEERLEVVRLNAAIPGEQRLAEDVELRSHPSFAVLDADGRVRQRFYGPQAVETLRVAVESVLP